MLHAERIFTHTWQPWYNEYNINPTRPPPSSDVWLANCSSYPSSLSSIRLNLFTCTAETQHTHTHTPLRLLTFKRFLNLSHILLAFSGVSNSFHRLSTCWSFCSSSTCVKTKKKKKTFRSSSVLEIKVILIEILKVSKTLCGFYLTWHVGMFFF